MLARIKTRAPCFRWKPLSSVLRQRNVIVRDRRTTRRRTQLGRMADDNIRHLQRWCGNTTHRLVKARTVIVFLCLNCNCSSPDFSHPLLFVLVFFFGRELLVATDQSQIQAEMQQEHSALLAAGGGCWNETAGGGGVGMRLEPPDHRVWA